MKTYYEVKTSKKYPGFYFIRHEDWIWDDTYLHKDGSIHTYYGDKESPEDMPGLWDNEKGAKEFLKLFNNKIKNPLKLMVEELGAE